MRITASSDNNRRHLHVSRAGWEYLVSCEGRPKTPTTGVQHQWSRPIHDVTWSENEPRQRIPFCNSDRQVHQPLNLVRAKNDEITVKIWNLLFSDIMDGKTEVRQPQRKWVDNIVDWCRAGIHELSYSVQQNQIEAETQGYVRLPTSTEPKINDVYDDDEYMAMRSKHLWLCGPILADQMPSSQQSANTGGNSDNLAVGCHYCPPGFPDMRHCCP